MMDPSRSIKEVSGIEPTPKKAEQKPETAHVIDPDGDVILIPKGCGSNGRIQASSHHLVLASPVFRAMLKGNFAEGKALTMTGAIELTLPDDDCEATLILMNIIHGKFSKVPQDVTISLLAEIAILVDKYQLHEAVHRYRTLWMSFANSHWKVSETDSPSRVAFFITCACICPVFDVANVFSWATLNLILETRACQKSDQLPLSSAILKEVNTRREQLIVKILEEVSRMKRIYKDSDVLKCTEECDMLVLGAFSIALKKLKKLVFHDTTRNMNSISVNDLFEKVKELRLHSVHVAAEDNGRPLKRLKTERGSTLKCMVKSQLIESVTKIRDSEKGLDLTEYRKV